MTVSHCSCANVFIYSAFMDQVEDGKIEIHSNDLPSFLYKTGTIYDPENEPDGLFQGFFLVRVGCFLLPFTMSTVLFSPRSIDIFLRVPLQQ